METKHNSHALLVVCKLIQQLWKTAWEYVCNLNICIHNGLAILLQGMAQMHSYVPQNAQFTTVFIEAYFIITLSRILLKYPSKGDGCINYRIFTQWNSFRRQGGFRRQGSGCLWQVDSVYKKLHGRFLVFLFLDLSVDYKVGLFMKIHQAI